MLVQKARKLSGKSNVVHLNMIEMQPNDEDVRAFLIAEVFRFIERIVAIPGVTRIAMLGSLLSSKANPKDVDLLITVDDEADLTALAKSARRLKGITQSKNKGADVFLANSAGHYIGRICHWSRCGPQFRATCDARSCGRREYLHDDLDDINLDSLVVKEPPLEIWPTVIYRQSVASDLLPFLARYEVNRSES
jgi:predicted nucleotidyltransferase